MSDHTPVIALVGPPNAGKSTLFNAILGKRVAVTGPRPGTTRDRSYGEAAWNNKKFILVDTGGLAKNSGDPLENNIREQTKLAIFESDIIIFVVDGKAPVSAAADAAKELKAALRAHKDALRPKVFLIANKVDSPKNIEEKEAEFTRLGLGPVTTVSAISGRGTGDFLDTLTAEMDRVSEHAEEQSKDVFATVAVVGRPNVGKSTLINHLAGGERVIVSPVAGTTRAAVDIDIVYDGKQMRFIDTAGMRRRSKIDLDVEEYSLFQAIRSIENSDVAILLLDAEMGQGRFEQTIAGRLKESIKGIVIGVNKIDTLEDKGALPELEESLRRLYPFLRFARIIPISAAKGQNIDKLLDAVLEAKNSRDKEVSEDEIKASLKDWTYKNPPKKLRSQKKPVIYAMKQVRTNPPMFILIVNDPKNVHYSYLRYLENQIRNAYGFVGTAIKVKARKPYK